jgi:hypothetical protein
VGGGGGGGPNRTQRIDDAFQHTVDVLKNIVVPKSHHQISASFECGRSSRVIYTSYSVLTAIDLDYQLRRLTAEVDDIAINWNFSAELQTIQSAIPQPEP